MSTKNQKEIAKILFEGRTTHAEIMNKYHLNDKQFYDLTRSVKFKKELIHLLETAAYQTQITLSRHGPIAAETLATLLNSEKPDVARRTALDIIDHNRENKKQTDKHNEDTADTLTEEEAWRQIKVLAGKL